MSHNTGLTHPGLSVRRKQAEVESRTLTVISGLGGRVTLGINNADINTLKTALLTRMFYCSVGGVFVEPPRVEPRDLVALDGFRKKMFRVLKRSSKLDLHEVVQMYKGRKRTIYENALLSLDEKPVS